MATHSSILAWKIPWTEEPGGPQSIDSLRFRGNRVGLAQYTLLIALLYKTYFKYKNSVLCLYTHTCTHEHTHTELLQTHCSLW